MTTNESAAGDRWPLDSMSEINSDRENSARPRIEPKTPSVLFVTIMVLKHYRYRTGILMAPYRNIRGIVTVMIPYRDTPCSVP